MADSHSSASDNPIGEPADACSVCMNRRDEHEGQDHQFVYGAADEPNPSDPLDLNELEAAEKLVDWLHRAGWNESAATVNAVVARLRDEQEARRRVEQVDFVLLDTLTAAGYVVVRAEGLAHGMALERVGVQRFTFDGEEPTETAWWRRVEYPKPEDK